MRLIRVWYHSEGERWWADSPDAPGYTAAGDSLDEVRELVGEGLPLFLNDDVVIDEALPFVATSGVTRTTGTVTARMSGGLRFDTEEIRVDAAFSAVPADERSYGIAEPHKPQVDFADAG